MALQKTIEKTVPGFTGVLVAEDAYWRVTDIRGDKTSLAFNVVAFVAGQQVETRAYKFAPSVAEGSANFIRQAYLYLKLQPEFAGAIDC